MESSIFVILCLIVVLVAVSVELVLIKAKYKKAIDDLAEYKRKEMARAIVLGIFSVHEERNKDGS